MGTPCLTFNSRWLVAHCEQWTNELPVVRSPAARVTTLPLRVARAIATSGTQRLLLETTAPGVKCNKNPRLSVYTTGINFSLRPARMHHQAAPAEKHLQLQACSLPDGPLFQAFLTMASLLNSKRRRKPALAKNGPQRVRRHFTCPSPLLLQGKMSAM